VRFINPAQPIGIDGPGRLHIRMLRAQRHCHRHSMGHFGLRHAKQEESSYFFEKK
jgi:hypothetical protein